MFYRFLLLPVAFVILALIFFFVGRRIGWSVAGFNPRWRTPLKIGAFFLAFLSLGLALLGFRYEKPVNTAQYVFCFDITLSQAVEDYFEEGKPVSRLHAAKSFVRAVIADLPPNSLVAVCAYHGVATETGYILLLPPIRKERTYAIEKALEAVDWRNAWQEGSTLAYVPLGTYMLLRKFEGPFNIIILGDGEDEFELGGPKIDTADVKQFIETQTRFLLVGVGKTTPSEVPEFDNKWRKIGCLPYRDQCYMSKLDEKNMAKAAAILRGKYYKLEDKEAIRKWLDSPIVGKETQIVKISYDWAFGLAAMFFLVLWILV